MHASLILLVVSLATSAIAAPVPAVAPFESPESLMERDSGMSAFTSNEKRRLASGVIPPGLNTRDDSWQGRRDDDLSELDEGNADGADDNDNVELEKRRRGGFKNGMNQRAAKEIDENDNVELEKRRHGGFKNGMNQRAAKEINDNDNVELEKRRRGGFKNGMNQRAAQEIDDKDNVELEKRRRGGFKNGMNQRDDDSEYTFSQMDEE